MVDPHSLLVVGVEGVQEEGMGMGVGAKIFSLEKEKFFSRVTEGRGKEDALGTVAMERMALALEVVGEEEALVVAGGGGMARFLGTLCTPVGAVV